MKKNVYLLVMFLFTVFIGATANDENEKLLVNENFQGWDAVSISTTETSVVKTTDFSNETLTYKLSEVQASPQGEDTQRFNYDLVSVGYLMCHKSETPYIELTPLNSITRVEFIHGATGSSRGYKLWKKVGDGDWEVVSDAFATPNSGQKVTVDIHAENVALKFTNLNSSQNAYLFDLKIYGNYVSSAPQVNLITSVNIAEAGTITRSVTSDTYDEGTTITLTAVRNFGYRFKNWMDENGNILSANASLEITLNTDKTVIAVFEAMETYSFLVNTAGSNWGEVSLSPEPTNGKYEAGTIVTASIVANPVTTFSFWENGTSEVSRIIQVNEDVEITATFDEIPFIVGWDFKAQEPRSSRKADYYSETTNTGIISMHKEDGSVINWLANTGSFSPSYSCIRKWTIEDIFDTDQRYFQASFSTKGYYNIEVNSMMGGNYQIHTRQTMQYSINGTDFTDLKTIDLTEAYNASWVECNAFLPADAENQDMVYIRWSPDVTSPKMGTGNDGTALTNIFIFAEKEFIPDDEAPVLITVSPAENSSNASANGSIVLTFNEKVQAGNGNITLNGEVLTGVFGSKTATFRYSNLNYNTLYTFVVPAGALQDMSGNAFEGMTYSFTTMNRPQPIAKVFDAVIASDGSGDFTTIQQAINAAPSNAASPYLIFIKNGKYVEHVDIPATKPYLHLIGQSRDGVIISDSRLSGTGDYHVSLGATVVVNSSDCYFENISFENSWGVEKQDGPQALALYANNDRIIFNNCAMRSYQDTYLTSTRNIGDRQYLQNCHIEGAVDFIYGAGDVFFDQCTIYCVRQAQGYIVAPNHLPGTEWGYVFSNCIIDGNNGVTTYLGRPWRNSPKAVFLNTMAKVDIYAAGWYYTMNAIPAIFADYGTMDKDGNPIDLSQRIEDYEYTDDEGILITGKAKKSLTDEEAAQYTLENVLSGNDQWDPRTKTESTEVPVIREENGKIAWSAVDYAICYGILKNGEVIDFTTGTEFTPVNSLSSSTDVYTVMAVAESGALSSLSNEISFLTTGVYDGKDETDNITYYTKDHILYINHLPEGATIELYDFQGHRIVSTTNSVIPVSQHALVRILSDKGMKAFKIIVK